MRGLLPCAFETLSSEVTQSLGLEPRTTSRAFCVRKAFTATAIFGAEPRGPVACCVTAPVVFPSLAEPITSSYIHPFIPFEVTAGNVEGPLGRPELSMQEPRQDPANLILPCLIYPRSTPWPLGLTRPRSPGRRRRHAACLFRGSRRLVLGGDCRGDRENIKKKGS